MKGRATLLAAALAAFALARPIAAHDGPHEGPTTASFNVGKNGDVNFREDLKIGNLLVRKGRYQFGHRVDDEFHIVTLTRIGANNLADAAIYEANTRVVPGRQARKASVVRAKEAADHSLHISIIEIQGEAGDHIPLSPLRTQ
ncbi:MAG TPA: hypothetical protein VIK60_17965 [Vicinamibacterales bacterium]